MGRTKGQGGSANKPSTKKSPDKKTHGASASGSDSESEESSFVSEFENALQNAHIKGLLQSMMQDAVGTSLDSLRNEVASLKDQISSRDEEIKRLRGEVDSLRADNDALEQYGRRGSLRISGIDEKHGENVTPAIVQIANDMLNLNPPLQECDIDVSHRLAKPKSAKAEEPRPVIVRFMTRKDRRRVIAGRSQLKSHNENADKSNVKFFNGERGAVYTPKIYINEDLTTRRAILFSIARNMQKDKHFAQAWTYNGNIKVKTNQDVIKPISCRDDFVKLCPDVDLTKYENRN